MANNILNNIALEGQNVRDAFQRRLPSDTSKDYYFIHRNTKNTQPVIIEYGFLDSISDDPNQLKNNYENYAEAVVRALANYIGVNYIPREGDIYIVQKGDSLWSISKKLGISVDELKNLNNLTSNLLSIGQVLKVPTSTNDEKDYIVKSKDTLYSIARTFGVSVSDLKKYNNITSDTLRIGQVLKIPRDEVIGDNYIVQKGDSLYSIALKYNTTVDELKKLNNLTSNLLNIGQIVKIPTNSINDTYENATYIVKSGDTLYSIAKAYGITQQELMDYNNLTSNLLSIGQRLRIPGEIKNTYIIKSGDTLYSVAKKFNTTVSEIKNKNNLSSDILSIGQVIAI